MQKKWKNHVDYLEQNVRSKTLEQMATDLKVERETLRLFLHHHKKFRLANDNNIIIRLLTELIGHPEYFMPTRKFFEETKIGQRRWWQLFKGEKGSDRKRIYGNLPTFKSGGLLPGECSPPEARQLKLFEE